jgi:exodeoxyribonuclease V alpha subunit
MSIPQKGGTALGVPARSSDLRALRSRGYLADLDVHFAGLLGRLGEKAPEVLLAAALASRATGEGHVCVSLADAAEELSEAGVARPAPEVWAKALRASRAVGRPGEVRPLVLDGAGRLYLYRYFAYEQDLAEDLTARAVREPGAPGGLDRGRAKEALGRFFPRPAALPPGEPDGQKVAAAVALRKSLCVISGGPGTGKTTTVVRILALLQELAGGRPLRVALAAPTGKAAARLQEAVKGAKAGLPCSEAVRRAIPEEASTLHRLLGSRPGSPEFRHGRDNPLPHDVVVVDEVSMVDLALMAKVVRALRPETRLILLGDRDQLASVEAGAVLCDLCDTGRDHGYSEGFARELEELTAEPRDALLVTRHAPLADCLALLRWSYRFGGAGGIGAASRAVNEGRADDALAALSAGGPIGQVAQVGWRPAPPPRGLASALEERVAEAFGPCLRAADAGEAFRSLGRFRILCGRREGPYGAAAVNRAVERALVRRGLLEPGREWYAGRPVLVTRNDYGLRLYNGDVGLALPDPDAGGALRVFFVAADGGVRRFAPLRLPACETVYAMTVHRSQGSEFEEVLLLLGGYPSRVLTRELVYTGLTRARARVEVWGSEEVLRAAVRARTRRASGLRDALWGPASAEAGAWAPEGGS